MYLMINVMNIKIDKNSAINYTEKMVKNIAG